MHELSIALNIVEIAEQELIRNGGERVRAVHLNLGSNVLAREALLFSFGLAAEGTRVEGSRLLIQDCAGDDLEIVGLEIEP
jgi:hydrogenase nickel incorporation protein HypA/HybF